MGNHRCVVEDSNWAVLEKLASFAVKGLHEDAFVLGFLRQEEISAFFRIIEKMKGGSGVLERAISKGPISIRTCKESFFSSNCFSTKTALDLLGAFYLNAKGRGFKKFYFFGNATFIMERPNGYEHFFGFESMINLIARRTENVHSLCGYARFAFPNELIEEAIKIHS